MTETELLVRLITGRSVTTQTERFIQIEDEGGGRSDWVRQGLSAQSVRWAEYEYTQYKAEPTDSDRAGWPTIKTQPSIFHFKPYIIMQIIKQYRIS